MATDAGDPNLTDEETIRITVSNVNRAPILVQPIDDQQFDEDCGRQVIVDLDDYFADPDGDALSFSVEGVEALRLKIDDENVLRIDPETDYNGSSDAAITASDGVNEQRFRLVAPSILPNRTSHKARNLRKVSFGEVSSASIVQANIGSQRLHGPMRDDVISDQFTIIILSINDSPVIVNREGMPFDDDIVLEFEVNEGDPISFRLYATDIDIEREGDELHWDLAERGGLPAPEEQMWQFTEDIGTEVLFAWQTIAGDGREAPYEPIFAVRDSAGAEDRIAARIRVSEPAAKCLEVQFHRGWNLASINIRPSDEELYDGDPGPEIPLMMAQLRRPNNGAHHVILMKNERGAFYSPQFGFNRIPYWNFTEGYQVRVDESVEATWEGVPINPQADVLISRGWNMIAYFPEYQLDASSRGGLYVISPIRDDVIIAKDGLGNFMIPARNFSNMPPWREGLGYQINVDQDVVLNYPQAQNQGAALAVNPEVKGRWADIPSTGTNMSLLITRISGVDLSTGDQVVAFDVNGRMVGSGLATSGMVGLAVWGKDITTDEVEGLLDGQAFVLKFWDSSKDETFNLSITRVQTGEGLVYHADGFSVVDAVLSPDIPSEFYLAGAYPNPFNSITRIAFGLPEAAHVSIRIYDLTGRVVDTIIDGDITAGHHFIDWTGIEQGSGIYIARIESARFNSSRKIVLIR